MKRQNLIFQFVWIFSIFDNFLSSPIIFRRYRMIFDLYNLGSKILNGK